MTDTTDIDRPLARRAAENHPDDRHAAALFYHRATGVIYPDAYAAVREVWDEVYPVTDAEYLRRLAVGAECDFDPRQAERLRKIAGRLE